MNEGRKWIGMRRQLTFLSGKMNYVGFREKLVLSENYFDENSRLDSEAVEILVDHLRNNTTVEELK
jgi:hypothetical protein